MAVFDYARLKSSLSNARIAVPQPALHQTILQLIDGTKDATDKLGQQITDIGGDSSSTASAIAQLNSAVAAINSKLGVLGSINLIEVDTNGGATSIDLVTVVAGFMIIKDLTGNAGANNITLTGTVEGVVNPVINSNYGFFHVYLGSDKEFHTW